MLRCGPSDPARGGGWHGHRARLPRGRDSTPADLHAAGSRRCGHPDLYDKAVELDEGLREHNPVPVFLDRERRPLRARYGGHEVAQARLELWTTEQGEECDAGLCDT